MGFAFPTLTTAEQKYSQIDKEALAVILVVKKSHHYLLLWLDFELNTDHKPLTHIFKESK